MGQDISKMTGQCGCQEGVLGMCGPEDPSIEQQSQIHTHAGTPYPSPSPEHDVNTNGYGGDQTHSRQAQQQQQKQQQQQEQQTPQSANRWENDTYEPMAPPPEGRDPIQCWGPEHNETSTPAPTQCWGPSPPVNNTGPPAAGADPPSLTLEVMLADLDGAEYTAYGAAFDSFSGNGAALQPSDEKLRDFIVTNSAITLQDLDMDLLKIASTNESLTIDKAGFLQLLRDNSINEGDALQQFMGMASDGESLPSEDCRTGLLNLIQQKLNTNFSDNRSEQIFDIVMVDAGLTVSMEQWVSYCKKVGRIVRLARYAHI